ncbi:MAG: hypothetical protein R3F14_23050 [Polyangiaceae bacterium]
MRSFQYCISNFPYYYATFVKESGPGTVQVTAEDQGAELILDGDTMYALSGDVSGEPFEPKVFHVKMPNRWTYTVHVDLGVTAAVDPYGNGFTVSPNGDLVLSNGKSLGFERDAEGRITKLVDVNGSYRTYQYNAAGDLIATTDALGGTTRYFYDRNHNMTRMIDPVGNVLLDLTYGSDGRVSGMESISGEVATIDYDLAAREVVTTGSSGASLANTTPPVAS